MNCPNCGAPLRDGAAFCTSCGSSVQAKRSKLKSTMPMDEPFAPQPAAQQPASPQATVVMPDSPGFGTSIYDTFEATMPKTEPDYRVNPALACNPMPHTTESPKKKSADGASKSRPILHKVRAWLAVVLAVGCVALLFFPWFTTCLEVEANVKVNGDYYDLEMGGEEKEVSILDVVSFSELDEILDTHMRKNAALEDALEEKGIKKSDYAMELLLPQDENGDPQDISTIELFGMNLPTGVVAMAPQLLCILLMVIFFIIGAIRVFAAEPFADGAPKTGWLKAGGIVGIVMSVITGAEIFVLSHYFQKFVDKFGSEALDADLDLSLGLLLAFFLFAAASVAVTLLATHWGKNKMKDDFIF